MTAYLEPKINEINPMIKKIKVIQALKVVQKHGRARALNCANPIQTIQIIQVIQVIRNHGRPYVLNYLKWPNLSQAIDVIKAIQVIQKHGRARASNCANPNQAIQVSQVI